MPARIQPERLRNGLSSLSQAVAAGAEALEYQSYYGLDLPHRPKVQRRLGRFRVGDYDIVAQAWWPEQPHATLLILHGYYDHMGLYRHVVDWGLGMGFAVLGCDLPGHGLSSGPRASINEFDEYQAVLSGLFEQARQLDLPRPWHLLGQSTGGAIAIDHLLHRPDDAELGRTILLAPLVRPRAWLRSRISYELVRRFVQQIPRTFSDNSGDPAFLDFVQRSDPLQPDILPTAWVGALSRWIPRIEGAGASPQSPIIIQGEADMTVDWRYNLPVLERKFAAPEILRLPGAKHHLVNEHEALRREYFDFLSERLK
ncbi:alpha/beta hydrolase [Pseudomonas saudiphocaensis]|uniref:alpha/beta hydrolase n=1 Tax=Pseudomonas saudiphocaensis TaxID=1499686 RepID=UPI000F77F5D9|nr:alpha/beta hydrolase [Pseudomonas saudiphocaensis]RRV17236.1 alpha/beta hydrolase [Pseudomonas saudiphocaensis]